MVNTQASAISRLENADYSGHSLTMLSKIVALFSGKLSMSIDSIDGGNLQELKFPVNIKLNKK